ncbi:MAG: hypothetical protein AAF360_08515 [Pseudomonadota bacterium]
MDFLAKELLMVMLLGNTHYIDVGRPNEAAIYYEDEDTAHMIFPDGREVTGAWRLTEAGYHVDWENGPKGEWRLARGDGRIYYVDAKGDDRGDVVRIVPGDAADLVD